MDRPSPAATACWRQGAASSSSPLDEALLSQAQQGDAQALSTLLEKIWNEVWTLCYHLTRNRVEAEDLFQDSLLRVYKYFPSYQKKYALKNWVYTIVYNTFRKSRSRRVPLLSLDAGGEETFSLSSPPTQALEKRLEEAELKQVIQEGLSKMTPQEKAVFVFRDVKEMDIAEISTLLGIRPATCRVHLSHARQKLKTYLEKRGRGI